VPTLAAKLPLPRPPSGEMTALIVDDDILSVSFSGQIDDGVVRQALVRVGELLTGRRVRAMLCDTLGVTGIDASAREPGREFLALVKRHGVLQSFCALDSTPVRMLSVALGLAIGVRIRFFSTVDEARAAARRSAERHA
jgi:hypothetical protein